MEEKDFNQGVLVVFSMASPGSYRYRPEDILPESSTTTVEDALKGWMKKNGRRERVYQVLRIETAKFQLKKQTVQVPTPVS